MAAGEEHSIFEGLCNPPGGDWSGISLTSENGEIEYRWTSLPRVTGDGGKRPDHVLQFTGIGSPNTILSIESKDRYQDFEANIGPRLVAYVNDLLRSPATITRSLKLSESWRHNANAASLQFKVLSAGAFVYSGQMETVIKTMLQNKLDVAVAFSFHDSEPSVARIVCSKQSTQRSQVRIQFPLPKGQARGDFPWPTTTAEAAGFCGSGRHSAGSESRDRSASSRSSPIPACDTTPRPSAETTVDDERLVQC